MYAVTTMLHMRRVIPMHFWMEFAESLVMCAAKLAVAHSAHLAHRHLSPVSRAVAGPWILVLAASKLLMALMAFIFAIIYATLHHGADPDGFCRVGFVFVWSCLGAAVFQTSAGFAMFQIRERAAALTGDSRVFTRIVGRWWGVLIAGTFGVGAWMWFCGMLFVLIAGPLAFLVTPVQRTPARHLLTPTRHLLTPTRHLLTPTRHLLTPTRHLLRRPRMPPPPAFAGPKVR
eukprot:gene32423-58893_t